MGIWTALTRNVADTATNPRLSGRTYAVPFAAVWDAALAEARAMPRWTVAEPDARTGTIRAEARTLLWRFTDDVVVRVSLDDGGMTRVDVRSSSRVGRGDLGANARRVARFLHRVDRRLRAGGAARAT
jgi:uncharacterized protein (DUF1499 family)